MLMMLALRFAELRPLVWFQLPALLWVRTVQRTKWVKSKRSFQLMLMMLAAVGSEE